MDTTIQWQGMNPPPVPEATSGKNSLWKAVTLGGVPGVLMGAGTLHALNKVHGNQDDEVASSDVAATNGEDGLQVATVDSDANFAEAFAAARAEVGPGGVFHWHGGIYNTYTMQEWNAMTDEQKHDFALQVKPEVQAGEINTDYITQATPTVTVHHDPALSRPVASTNHPADAPTEDNKPLGVVIEQDGHTIQYYGEECVIMQGQPVDIVHARIDGQEVALVDLDGDGTADLAMSDLNGNGEMDYGEVYDFRTGEVIDLSDDVHYTSAGPDEAGGVVIAGEHFDGPETVDTPAGEIDVYTANIDGQPVEALDIDRDGVPDVAIADVNGNGALDPGEAIDLHSGEPIITDDMMAQGEDLAPDMPDYTEGNDLLNATYGFSDEELGISVDDGYGI